MSIKHFHTFFILMATLFCLGVGAWLIWHPTGDTGRSHMGLGIFFVLFGIALAAYGRQFLKKMKQWNGAS